MKNEEHGCINSKIFDRVLKRMIPCPLCKQERTDLAEQGLIRLPNDDVVSIYQYLGMHLEGTSPKYIPEYLIGNADRYYIEPSTYRTFNSIVENVLGDLILGEQLDYSLMLYAGKHARLEELACVFLMNAYQGGFSIAPIVTYSKIRSNVDYQDMELYLNSDIAVGIITSGVTNEGIQAFKGLVQERSLRGKATIILLSDRYNFHYRARTLCSLDGKRKDLCLYAGVSYKDVDMSKEDILILRKIREISNENLNLEQSMEVFISINQKSFDNAGYDDIKEMEEVTKVKNLADDLIKSK